MVENKFTHTKRARNSFGAQFGYNNGESKASKLAKQAFAENASKGNFDFDSIHGFKLLPTEFKTPGKKQREDTRLKFKTEERAKFLNHIATNFEPELRTLGVTNADLTNMKKGIGVKGFNVHHKLPIHGGGTNDFKNLIFMPIPPHDELHHKIIDPQIKGQSLGKGITIKLPWTDDMVWKKPERIRQKEFTLPRGIAARIKQKSSQH